LIALPELQAEADADRSESARVRISPPTGKAMKLPRSGYEAADGCATIGRFGTVVSFA